MNFDHRLDPPEDQPGYYINNPPRETRTRRVRVARPLPGPCVPCATRGIVSVASAVGRDTCAACERGHGK